MGLVTKILKIGQEMAFIEYVYQGGIIFWILAATWGQLVLFKLTLKPPVFFGFIA